LSAGGDEKDLKKGGGIVAFLVWGYIGGTERESVKKEPEERGTGDGNRKKGRAWVAVKREQVCHKKGL